MGNEGWDANEILKARGAKGGGGETREPKADLRERERVAVQRQRAMYVWCWFKARVLYIGERCPKSN